MVKYTIKNYATALVDSIIKNQKQPHLVDNFLALLKKNGDMKKVKEIVAKAQTLLLKKTGNKRVTIQTARKGTFVPLKFLKKGDVITEQIHPELIAGVKIIVDNEQQLDFSLQKKLNQIF